MSKKEEMDNKPKFDNFNAWLRNRQIEAHRALQQNVRKASFEQQPVEQQPVQQKPVQQKPVQQKPVQQQPVQQQPVQQQFTLKPADLFHRFKSKTKSTKNATIHGSFEEFSDDFLSILNDTSSSDVTIKSGTETLKAHRIILSARSPVFKAMFSNKMRESAEGTISIDGIEPEVLRDMLFFIYSNQVQNLSVPKACHLLDAAEKYQLQTLKSICADFLMSSLSVENAFLILQTADLYDKKLKLDTMKFIRDKFSDLKATEEWKTVQSRNPTLALEVLNMVVEHFT